MTDYTANAVNAPATPRIFCIGRNYAEHVAELDNAHTLDCIVFMKPLTALVTGDTIPVRVGGEAVHHEAELVVEIAGGGRDIGADAAPAHIAGLGLGLDLTLRGLQGELQAASQPWEKAKSFDASAAMGPLRPFDPAIDLSALSFRLDINGQCRQHGDTGMMLFGVCELIARLSAHWTLLPGDLIYTGTPQGVAEIAPGDKLALFSDSLPSAGWTAAADA